MAVMMGVDAREVDEEENEEKKEAGKIDAILHYRLTNHTRKLKPTRCPNWRNRTSLTENS